MATALREVLAHFGIEVEGKELERADHLIEKVTHGLHALAEAFAIKEIWEFGAHIAEQGEQLALNAERLGISAQALQELNFAAGQSGVSAEGLTMALSHLEQVVGGGVSQTGAKFAKFGINIKNANGEVKDADELLEAVADKMAGLKSNAAKTAMAVGIFGRQGRMLLPMLKEGSKGIREQREDLAKLGGGLSKDTIGKSQALIREQKKLGVGFESIKSRIAEKLLPVLMWLVNQGSRVITWLLDVTAGTHVLELALYALGAALTVFGVNALIALMPILVPFALITLAVAGLILLIDDLIGLFTGKDSEIGHEIDALFGKGASTTVIEVLRDAWHAVAQAINWAKEDLKQFIDEMSFLPKFGGWLGDMLAKEANAESDFFDNLPGDRAEREQDRRRNLKLRAQGKNSDGSPLAYTKPSPYFGPEQEGGSRETFFDTSERRRLSQPGSSSSATNHVSAPMTNHITINGAGDADAVGKVVVKHLDDWTRGAWETFPMRDPK